MIGSFLKNKIIKNLLKIEDGRIKFFGKIDYIMFPASAMAEFLQKVYNDIGEDYLFDLGYVAGIDGANEMVEKLGLLNNPIFLNKKIILSMFETLGFGNMDLRIIKSDQCLLYLKNHPVIEAGKYRFGRKSRVCSHYRGIFSIHGEKDLKIKGCKFIETQCVSKGKPYCEWSYNFFKNK